MKHFGFHLSTLVITGAHLSLHTQSCVFTLVTDGSSFLIDCRIYMGIYQVLAKGWTLKIPVSVAIDTRLLQFFCNVGDGIWWYIVGAKCMICEVIPLAILCIQ